MEAVIAMEKINEIYTKAVEVISEQGYGISTQRKRRFSFLRILRLHEQSGEECYNEELVAGYVTECEDRFKRGEIVWERCRELTKAAQQLAQICDTGTIISCKRTFVPPLPEYFDSLQKLVSKQSEWSEKERTSIRYVLNRFFEWLMANGYDRLDAVDGKVLRHYLIHCAGYMSGSGLDNVRRLLRKAFSCFFANDVISDEYDRIFSFTVPIAKKIRPGIPHSEIAATLKMTDCDAAQGKRDYAIMLIATVTGLRAVDISELEIDSIDWMTGEIRLTQSKTHKSVALPLTTDVGKAVHDYIVNARPVCGIRNVFLSVRAPIRALSSTAITVIHNSYRQRAELPKSGVHGLRRALGSGMVSAFVPVTTVMQVLGQTELNSTKPYTALNSRQLKECALGFAGIEPIRGDAQ
jgi:site-specific recombinase XerD